MGSMLTTNKMANKKEVAKKMPKKGGWAWASDFKKRQKDVRSKSVKEAGYHTLPESASYKEPKKATSGQLKKWREHAEKRGTLHDFERVVTINRNKK